MACLGLAAANPYGYWGRGYGLGYGHGYGYGGGYGGYVRGKRSADAADAEPTAVADAKVDAEAEPGSGYGYGYVVPDLPVLRPCPPYTCYRRQFTSAT